MVPSRMDKLIRGIRTGGSLGCGDHALAEFLISRNMGLAKSSQDRGFWKSELVFIQVMNERDLLGGSP